MAERPVQIYIDESIHSSLGFIVTAFVFSKGGLDGHVAEALTEAGLRPGTDEFKSGAFMADDPRRRKLRESLLGLAGQNTRIALAVSPAASRPDLGAWCLNALDKIIRKNGFRGVAFEAHIDEGIFRSHHEAIVIDADLGLQGVSIHPSQDSRACLGIQVADAVAHVTAQVIRAAVTGHQKIIGIGGPETGYADDDTAPLGWALKMTLRYALLSRRIAVRGSP